MKAQARRQRHWRVISGIVAVAFVGAAGTASAQWWNPMSPIPPGKWAVLGRDFKYTDQTYEQAKFAILDALQKGDFAKLDRMHDEFLAMFVAQGNGHRMLGAFRDVFLQGFGAERPDDYAKLFADWRAAAPQSQVRPVAEGAMWSRFAWNARGNGYGAQVSPEAFRIFHERLLRAAGVLQEGETAGRGSPLWHWLAVTVAGSLDEPPALLDGFVDDAASRFPVFLPLYQTRLNFLLPQWGGNYDRVDAFIRHAVKLTQKREGTTLYAVLYREVRRSFSGDDFFRDTRASWPLMRHAFEDEVADGRANLNTYATYACMAGDRETTRRLIGELGDNANLGAGIDGFTTEACMEMAKAAR